MDDCDFAQQWPRLWGADSSPSTLMALPSCTVTQTPHSTLPQARQHVRTCFSSPAVASASSARARMGATAEELTAAAAPVIAIVFMKLRRDMVSCAIKSPPLSFLFLCRFSPAPKWSGLSPDSAEGWRCALRPLPPRPRRFPRDADRTVPYGRHSTEARIVPLHRRLMIWDYYSEGRGSYEPF